MQISELTALYSPLDVKYNQAMSGPYQDLSYHGRDCMIIAGLKDGRISGFWRPVVAVGDEKALKLHIERLYDISRDIVYMDFLEGGRLSVISQFLLRQGYTARPYYTQIINLIKPEDVLYKNLRKSYKQLVKYPQWRIVEEDLIDSFWSLYRQIHGGNRIQITWDIQKRMVENNEAILVVNEQSEDKILGGVLIYYHDGQAYYASGASGEHVCSHNLIWNAMLWLKKYRSCVSFELGEQVFSGNTKLVNISKFKRGFGGQTVTRLILKKESK